MLPIVTTIFSWLTNSTVKYLGLALAVAVLLIAVLWYRGQAIEAQAELQVVQIALDAERVARLALQEASERQAKALAEREIEIQTINAEREALGRRWKEALRHDETVRDWADAPLPDAVRGLFQ